MWPYHEMGWWMFLAMIWFALIWALVVWVLVRLVSPANRSGREEAPLDLARRRYAKGEISRDDYERLRKDLTPRV